MPPVAVQARAGLAAGDLGGVTGPAAAIQAVGPGLAAPVAAAAVEHEQRSPWLSAELTPLESAIIELGLRTAGDESLEGRALTAAVQRGGAALAAELAQLGQVHVWSIRQQLLVGGSLAGPMDAAVTTEHMKHWFRTFFPAVNLGNTQRKESLVNKALDCLSAAVRDKERLLASVKQRITQYAALHTQQQQQAAALLAQQQAAAAAALRAQEQQQAAALLAQQQQAALLAPFAHLFDMRPVGQVPAPLPQQQIPTAETVQLDILQQLLAPPIAVGSATAQAQQCAGGAMV